VFQSVFRPGARENEGKLDVDLAELACEDRAASLAEFTAALKEGRPPLTSGADNLRSLAMILAARRSAEIGRKVTLAEVLADGDSDA
jgi:predicted dehydrogenase